jgi:hypothetical protein
MIHPWSYWINSSIPNLYRLWQVLRSDSLACRCGRRPHWIARARLPGCLAGEVWRVAAGKLELVAPAGGQAGTARTRGPVARRTVCRVGAGTSGPRRQPGGTGDRVILAAHRGHRR